MSVFKFNSTTKLANFAESTGTSGSFCTLIDGTNKYETGIYGGFFYKSYSKDNKNGNILHRFIFETATGESIDYVIFEPTDLSKVDERRAALILSDLAYFGRMFVPTADDSYFLRDYDNGFEEMLSHCVFALMNAAFGATPNPIVPEFHFKLVFQNAEQTFPYTKIAMDKPNMATFVNGQPYYGIMENIKYGPKDVKVCTIVEKKNTQQPTTFTGAPLPSMPGATGMPGMPAMPSANQQIPANQSPIPNVAPATMPNFNNPGPAVQQNAATPTPATQAPAMPVPGSPIPTIAPAQAAGAPTPTPTAPNPTFPNFG